MSDMVPSLTTDHANACEAALLWNTDVVKRRSANSPTAPTTTETSWAGLMTTRTTDRRDQMTLTFRADENDDANFETLPNGQKILRDGGRMRTSMMALDGLSRDVRERFGSLSFDDVERGAPRFHDGRGNAVGHRPGFIVDAAAGRAARRAIDDAHADYEKSQAEAWKGPPTDARSQGPRETRSVGDRCLIQGQNGHLYEADDGSLVCVPDQWGDAALDDRAIEHARYIDHITNAWRHPDGDAVPDRGPVQRADAALTREELYAAYDREIAAAYRNVKP